MTVAYRVSQFLQSLRARPDDRQIQLASQYLTPPLLELYRGLPAADRAHAARVLGHLLDQGEKHPELLAAALLHDVGKALHPPRLHERVLAVLGARFFPFRAALWGQGPPRGWRRAFVIARQHPRWGAELAAARGASALLCELIRRHQEPPPANADTLADRLLLRLQEADGAY